MVTAFLLAVALLTDISYRPAEGMCRLDLVHPTGVTGFPTIVWFHGGGLTGGRRRFIDVDTNRFAVVAVDYRLMKLDGKKIIPNGPVSPAAILDDAAAAAFWVKANIARFGGDPDRIFIAGHSAGGYLTFLLGLNPRILGAYGLAPKDFAGYFPLSGQATKHFGVREYFGQGENQLKPIIDEWAPIYYAAKETPPFLIVLGDRRVEWPMRVQENEYFHSILRALGNENVTFVSIPDATHGTCYLPSMAHLTRFVDDVCARKGAR